jgi:hypothetical protein
MENRTCRAFHAVFVVISEWLRSRPGLLSAKGIRAGVMERIAAGGESQP